jgi:hypothetical protein
VLWLAAHGGCVAGLDGAPELAGYWPLDENGITTTRDQSGNGRHGAIEGRPATTTCQRRTCLAFAGGDALSVPNLSATGFPTSGTLAFWFSGDFSTTAMTNMFDHWDNDRDHIYIRHFTTPDEIEVKFQPQTAGGMDKATFAAAFPVKSHAWNHLTVVWDGVNNVGKVYLDRALVVSKPYLVAWKPTGQSFRIDHRYVGKIDDLRLYDRVLGDAEIARLP